MKKSLAIFDRLILYRIEVLPEPNYLLISLHNDHADCDPIYVRFDLDTKEWFWLTMEAKPIEPFN